MLSYRACWLSLAILCTLKALVACADGVNEDANFFELKVRPLLAANCQGCHGSEEQNGNLRLDSKAAILQGGDQGAAVVPGKPDESLIVRAVSYSDGDLQMPPTEKLGDSSIDTIRQWIRTGAYWPPPANESDLTFSDREFRVTDRDREHWSFRPIVRPKVPIVENQEWYFNPIDAFVMRNLDKAGLRPNPTATRRELVRRATYDLIGLPPAPEEVEAFTNDATPDAYERLIDRMLASPHYGEKWAEHWLDIARYSQTDGYQNDKEKPDAWRYRDYVIRSLNDDKPYDRFVTEQIAGDELLDATPDSVIATGFLRLGLWNNEPVDEENGVAEEYDEMVRTTSEAFLGLTVGCARCHDHKFDPIPQEDYYRISACFRNVLSYGTRIDHITFRYNPDSAGTPLFSKNRREAWREFKRKCDELSGSQKSDADKRRELEEIQTTCAKDINDTALSVRETGATPPPTHVFVRGNPLTLGKEVTPGGLSVLEPITSPLRIEPPLRMHGSEYQKALCELGIQSTSGRRLALARWIVNPSNPLTARVAVNRLWQYHFGRGIVATASDFGRTGQKPSNPELLDWMAAELVASGWHFKPLHKQIMMSRAYRQSSVSCNPAGESIDPDNALLWRQNLRRVDAESFRDGVLAVNGRLNRKMGGPSFFAPLPPEVKATQTKPGKGWGESTENETLRRSVYIYRKRSLAIPLLEVLDRPNGDLPQPVRAVTTVAPQALILLNNSFMEAESEAMATRLERECGDDIGSRIDRAIWLALARPATESEVLQLKSLFDLESEVLQKSGKPLREAEHAALGMVCKIVFNLNEFLYVD